jgi:hypothetical protein
LPGLLVRLGQLFVELRLLLGRLVLLFGLLLGFLHLLQGLLESLLCLFLVPLLLRLPLLVFLLLRQVVGVAVGVVRIVVAGNDVGPVRPLRSGLVGGERRRVRALRSTWAGWRRRTPPSVSTTAAATARTHFIYARYRRALNHRPACAPGMP